MNREMKIGVFVSKVPLEGIELYGSERYTYKLCKGLADLSNKITLFVPFNSNRIIKKDNLEIYFCKSHFKIQNYLISLSLFYKPLKMKFDIINVHNDSFFEMLAGFHFSVLKKVPLIVNWHGDLVGDKPLRKIITYVLNRTLIKIILSRTSAIRVPSIKYVNKSNILKSYRSKIVEIPNGIEIETADMPYSKEKCKNILNFNNRYLILYVGHVSEVKGVDILLKSIPLVIRKNSNIKFVFIGGGDIIKYEFLAKKLDISNYVKFTGYLDGEKKWLYYKAADIFIFPSIAKHEIFGNVNIEASIFGLPIIATDLKAIQGIVKNNYNGILFEKGNSEILAKNIISLLNSEELRSYLGKNARKIVKEKFSLKIMVLKTIQLYNRIIKRVA